MGLDTVVGLPLVVRSIRRPHCGSRRLDEMALGLVVCSHSRWGYLRRPSLQKAEAFSKVRTASVDVPITRTEPTFQMVLSKDEASSLWDFVIPCESTVHFVITRRTASRSHSHKSVRLWATQLPVVRCATDVKQESARHSSELPGYFCSLNLREN